MNTEEQIWGFYITMNKAEICLPANHLPCIARWAAAAASTDSNRKYTHPALFLYDITIWIKNHKY